MKALITGITGQDGSYLSELLLSRGYEVHGIVRRASSLNTGRIDHIFDRLHLHHGDMTDAARLRAIVDEVVPDEVYNLAGQSHVRVSFDQPRYTFDTNALGTLNLLEALRGRNARIYQASSSEMFGNQPGTGPHNEQTEFRPVSPYGVAKCAAHHICSNYRNGYRMHISCGILFNHESPRRGETFVTRKITLGLARIKMGLQDTLKLGNLSAIRDWGFAGDYVEAMWLMLQRGDPGNYVIGTGVAFSVLQFLDRAADYLGVDWRKHVEIDKRLLRPSEITVLVADATRARMLLNWEPRHNYFQLVEMMAASDLKIAEQEALCKKTAASM